MGLKILNSIDIMCDVGVYRTINEKLDTANLMSVAVYYQYTPDPGTLFL